MELDINDNSWFNIFDIANEIIQNSNFIINQDEKDFCYGKNKKINMEELIQLKNKIYMNIQKKNNDKEPDPFQIKCEKLVFFKESISNLEMIRNNLKVLRQKGSSLPILINIKLEYPNIKYYLNKIETNFGKIKDFLLQAIKEQKSQLDLFYKKNRNLRFLYGNLFNRIFEHLNGGDCPYDILRYILNKINNKEDIIDGEIRNQQITRNYVEQYKLYNENSFRSISNYIISFFEKNCASFQKHYEKMLIKAKNKYKGFYLHKCENDESMEEFIINIFLEKIGLLPLSQNVLILNKETSLEEMQAFFNRAILCDYNTLFIVQINDSFSINQQNVMFNIIDSLISYKNKVFNESGIKYFDINKAYLKSCIVFIYNDKIKENSFLVELGKFNPQEIGSLKSFNNNIKENIFENIEVKVITSDICGLGKSHKIKKMIESDKKQYYHFILGGKLTKTVIYDKFLAILKKIKKENGENYEKVSIHLDLKESKETSIINEFLFSFLITKFYINNGNIIYIPKDIQIYIEIPNCFEDYLSKFGILNIFKLDNISLNNIPILDLPKDIINILSLILGFKSTKEIDNFIKENIQIEKYSYYQVKIFINIFISIYGKFNRKVNFLDANNKEYTYDFGKSTKYFINEGFAKIIKEINENKNIDYIDLLSHIYDNDLKSTNFDTPLIFINKEKKIFELLKLPDKKSNKFKNLEDYLIEIKKVLFLPNDIEKDLGDKKSLKSILNYKTENFVITEDNFKKMILLIYRIQANIPVIIMGETGCGKTLLVIKLSQILNNGEIKVRIINIRPDITEEDICKEMKRINEEAKCVKDEIWIFFDDINTCQSLSLLTEIFNNRTYNGEKINENIRLIGAYTPYRKRKIYIKKYNITSDIENEKENELVYSVELLPQSLLYFVFNFGIIDEEDEKNYIYQMIEKLFSKEEQKLHDITSDAILECHQFLRNISEPSIVSLRDISRFYKCVEFLQKYFSIKDEYLNKDLKGKEKLYKIKSIICSIYICYNNRFNDLRLRTDFDYKLKHLLLNLVNVEKEPEEENEDEHCSSFSNLIKYKELKDDFKEIHNFREFLESEEEFLLDLMELDKGIAKNMLLKENIFLLFISINKLIYKLLRGKYSKNKFFRKFPPIISTYFQGSEFTNPEDVEKLFEIAENKYKYFIKKNIKIEDFPISMILFDHLGLAEKSETNPLKILYSKLDYNDKNKDISFIGISNCTLDNVIMNRALTLSAPNLEESLDDLLFISEAISKSISEDLFKNERLLFALTNAYFDYKYILKFLKKFTVFTKFSLINKESKNPIDLRRKQFWEVEEMKEYINLFIKEEKIKVDFHDNRDFYNYIKGIALELKSLTSIRIKKSNIF